MKEKKYNTKELTAVIFVGVCICLSMTILGFNIGRDYEKINTPKNEIVDYFCNDLKGATCVYDACWKELHKRQEMCNKVK